MPLSFEILDANGGPVSGRHARVLTGQPPRFISCDDISLIKVRLEPPAQVCSVRVLFAMGHTTDTLNSWVRGVLIPPPGTVRIEGLSAAEQRFQVSWSGSGLAPDGLLIELCLDAPAMFEQLLLRVPSGPFALHEISLAAEPFEGQVYVPRWVVDLPAYARVQQPIGRAGDPLGDELRGIGEPTVEAIWRVCQPYRGAALLGQVEGPIAAATWDGGLIFPRREGEFDRIWLRPGGDPSGADPSRQGLLSGWLPVSVIGQGAERPFAPAQLAFVDLSGCLRARLSVPALAIGEWHAARTRLERSENTPAGIRVLVREAIPCERNGDSFRLAGLSGTLSPAGEGLDLCLPLRLPQRDGVPCPPRAAAFDEALGALRAHFTAYLERGARLSLPSSRLDALWRALCVHNALFQRAGKMRYGLFPGAYEDAIFGVEEGWNIVAMAYYGQGRSARELFARTFCDAEFLAKEGQHHQYRNGLCMTYALEVFRLTGDRAWLGSLLPIFIESAEFIAAGLRSTQVLERGVRPPHYGLMPRHTYGGDLRDPAYSLYGSSACWRGLRDAALIMGLCGEVERAARYDREAQEARANMNICAERIYRSTASPPFLPFRTDETRERPSSGDYYQLFASLILETALFGWRSRWARAITDYLTQTGRLVLGVARFDEWFGRLGIDAQYTRGVQLYHLVRRDFDAFWRGVIGHVALSCDPFTFVTPETAIVRFSREEYKDRMRTIAENPSRLDSDPCSAGAAVILHYLRFTLAFEERDDDDLPTGLLWLSPGAPPSWFAEDKKFGVADLPTTLGRVSFTCASERREVVYEIEVDRPMRVETFFVDRNGVRRSEVREIRERTQIVLAR